MAASTWAASVTSARANVAASPSSDASVGLGFTSAMTARPPAATSIRADAAPRPDAPPVINAPFPSIRMIGGIAEIFREPLDPAAIHVAAVNRICGTVAAQRVGDELSRNVVIAQRVVEAVGLRNRHTIVAGVGQGQRWRLYSGRVPY